MQDGDAADRGQAQPGRRVLDVGERARSQAGDALDVMPPMGHFNVPLDPAARRHYVGFAAGSGITPLLSIVKTTLAAEPRVASSRCSTAIARPAR